VQGWFAVRLELRKLTWLFLGILSFFICAWSMMFVSSIYRFLFVDWPFFGCMTIFSFLALLSSTGFAIVCLHNYDKGLAQWCTLSFFPMFGDPVLILPPGVGTVYVEHAFRGDDFEPDLFPVDVTEKEWKPDADRASVYKAALPELLRYDPGMA
jgi:hypothetical protein